MLIRKTGASVVPPLLRKVRGYVPETSFWKDKTDACVRVCRESCAVLDPASGEILAMRQGEMPAGGCASAYLPWTLFCGASDISSARVREAVRESASHSCALLEGRHHCVLLIFDALSATGTVLAVDLPADASEIANGLRLIGIDDCWMQNGERRGYACRRASVRAEQLGELFRYLCGIMDPCASIRDRVRSIAEFVGCDLRSLAALPDRPLALIENDDKRLYVFLTCLLLIKRYDDGAKLLTDPFFCRVAGRLPAFFAYPAFSDIAVSLEGSSLDTLLCELCTEAPMPRM